MKKWMVGIALSSLLLLGATGCTHTRASAATPAGVDKQSSQVTDRVQMAADDLDKTINAPDSAISKEILAKAKCVAVIPDMVKGGFVIGGQHGRGVATCRTSAGWTAPAFFTLTGGNWGAQIGAESVDLVMLIMNDKGMNQLLESNWKRSEERRV